MRLVSIHLADFRFSSSAEVGFFPFFLKNVVILFFFPSNPKGASYFISLSSFLVFPDWQVWCCLSMMVTCCWLLPRPQTRQLDFVVHPYACTYVHLFFSPPLLPRELLRLYSPPENPVPGYRPSCDGGTWWPSPVLQVTTRQVRNFFGESEAMNSWLLDKIHIDREPLANYYVRITRARDTKNKVSSVCQLALHNSCWGRYSPTF